MPPFPVLCIPINQIKKIMNTTTSVITPELIASGIDYPAYRKLVDDLLAQGKTTGENHSEAYIHYTEMGVTRMNRLDKKTELTPELVAALSEVQEKWTWLVMVEAWCGDVGQNLPVIARMADQNPNIDLRIIMRDENPEVINAYLTNGGKSVPKMVVLKSETLEELGTWGPRPAPAQEMVMEYKHREGEKEPYLEFVKKVQLWYSQDKSATLMREFTDLVREWNQK